MLKDESCPIGEYQFETYWVLMHLGLKESWGVLQDLIVNFLEVACFSKSCLKLSPVIYIVKHDAIIQKATAPKM